VHIEMQVTVSRGTYSNYDEREQKQVSLDTEMTNPQDINWEQLTAGLVRNTITAWQAKQEAEAED